MQMSKIIENPKSYTGRELENIFFRPMLTGPDALDLGVRVMYNMPVLTMLNFWPRPGDVLQKYAKGWKGGDTARKFQKTINLFKIKAEMGCFPNCWRLLSKRMRRVNKQK